MIKLTYVIRQDREKLYSLDEIRAFGLRHDWPGVKTAADRLIRNPDAVLSAAECRMIAQALEIDQDKLNLGESGDYFEVELT